MSPCIGCCLAMCCLSGKSRQSFPINVKSSREKSDESNNLKSPVTIRPVETIRLNDDQRNTVGKYETKKSTRENPTPLEKSFNKARANRTPSPLTLSIHPLSEENDPSGVKSSLGQETLDEKHISELFSAALGQDASVRKKIPAQSTEKNNTNKGMAKSKLLLQNVRKMIDDKTIAENGKSNETDKL